VIIRHIVAAIACVVLSSLSSLHAATVVNQNRYLKAGTHNIPSALGQQQGITEQYSLQTNTSTDFAPYSATLNNQGAHTSQDSSFDGTTLSDQAFIQLGASTSGNLNLIGYYGESYCQFDFTVLFATPYSYTSQGFWTNTPSLTGPGAQLIQLTGGSGSGVLAPGTWTYLGLLKADTATFANPGYPPTSTALTLSLTPEPSCISLVALLFIPCCRSPKRSSRLH
jgi:hypothetical protein